MDRLGKLLQAQLDLIHKIGPVYSSNGFDEWTRAPHLNGRIHQAHIKYVAWCFFEELIEAEDAPEDKVQEEIVDALHFLLELMIMCGVDANELFRRTMHALPTTATPTLDRWDYMFFMVGVHRHPAIGDRLHQVTSELGRAMYQLKQKPWRITDRPTDVEELWRSLGNVFCAFIAYAKSRGFEATQLYVGYFEKNGVNHNRVAEKY